MSLDINTIETLFGLQDAGSAATQLIKKTYGLYKRNLISIEELSELWSLKVQLVKEARGDWVAAGQASQPVPQA